MKQKLTSEERLERLRMLAERLELDRLPQRTPAQLRRLADLERLLEPVRSRETPERTRPRGKTAA